MKLSIITINYNNKAGLQRTIESVVAQTCKLFEWIIIDGGSTDGSKELIEQYQDCMAFWCSEPDNGIYHAMNKGIQHASGCYCLFLNSGDRFHDENVVKNAIKTFDSTDFITGIEWKVDDLYQPIKIMIPPQKIENYYMIESALSHQSTFIKTSVLKRRPYDDSLKITADWEEMFYEMMMNNKTYKSIDIVITDFLVGGISQKQNIINSSEREKVLNKYLSRKERDLILLKHYSSQYNNRFVKRLVEVAYAAFVDRVYSQREYLELFEDYRGLMRKGGVWFQTIFVRMCLNGKMDLASNLYKMLILIKRKR